MTERISTSPVSESCMGAIKTRLCIPAITAWQLNISPKVDREGLSSLEVEQAAVRAGETLSANFKELFLVEGCPYTYATTTLKSIVIPQIWRSIHQEGQGILCSYEDPGKSPYEGQYLPLSKRKVILSPTRWELMKILARHCDFYSSIVNYKDDGEKIYTSYNSQGDAEERQSSLVVWDNNMYRKSADLCRSWIRGQSLDHREDYAVCQIIAGICFFTGRRPWSEVGCKSTFSVAKSVEGVPPEDDWADGWVKVTGLAKKTARQKANGEDMVIQPISGVKSYEIVDAYHDLHDRLNWFDWFDAEDPEIQKVVKKKFSEKGGYIMDQYFRPIFTPAIEKCNRKYVKLCYRLFRQLYSSYLYELRRSKIVRDRVYSERYELQRVSKLVFAMQYLAHENSSTSALYDFWEYDPNYVYA